MMATEEDAKLTFRPLRQDLFPQAAASTAPGLGRAAPEGVSASNRLSPVIYLLRHGDAEPDQGRGDAARRLTEEGETQAEAAGLAMARLGINVDTCLASPRVRAFDTATLACRALGIRVEVVEAIGMGDYDSLALAAGRGDALIVGHEPDMSAEVARLTGANIKMKKGGLAIIKGSQLQALLRPAELSAIAEA
jgi:phosphohistidine phosphatase